MRTISVVTPCRNAASLIGRTVESVLNQTAVRENRIRLQYIVCDGASTDGTVELVKRLCGESVEVLSEFDRGMYDALAKGLKRAEGEIVAYINAGDVYHRAAFDVVSEVFTRPGVRWLTGMRVLHNDRGHVISTDVPYRYRRSLVKAGVYGRWLPFIQQESTFWRGDLMAQVDLGRLAKLRLAGDYYLWTCFARKASLTVVEAQLGGFLVHEGQQSENRGEYFREVAEVTHRPGLPEYLLTLIDAPVWLAPPRVKKILNPRHFIRWSRRHGAWL